MKCGHPKRFKGVVLESTTVDGCLVCAYQQAKAAVRLLEQKLWTERRVTAAREARIRAREYERYADNDSPKGETVPGVRFKRHPFVTQLGYTKEFVSHE